MLCMAASGAQLPARPQSLQPVLHLRTWGISSHHLSLLGPSPPTSLRGKHWALPIFQMSQSSPMSPIPPLEAFIPSSEWVLSWTCLSLPICAMRAFGWPSCVESAEPGWLDRWTCGPTHGLAAWPAGPGPEQDQRVCSFESWSGGGPRVPLPARLSYSPMFRGR